MDAINVVVIKRLDRYEHVLANVILFSTHTTMPAEQFRALHSARFQLEFDFRDAKQHAKLTTCQLQSTMALENHWNALFFALNLGRAEVILEINGLQYRLVTSLMFFCGDIKRRAYNRLLTWQILSNLGLQSQLAE
ncbi:hypothetical protein ACI3L1_05090 [Deinococcus sp. SM5_A1]|uniref:hypothetical protein n=1 Tax=Deinococcus sp. SM5_A1 TaxID=3379094 RepID=UPI00385B59A7